MVNKSNIPTIEEEKEALREKIAKQIRVYLSKGGVIKRYPRGESSLDFSHINSLGEVKRLGFERRNKSKTLAN